MRRFLPAACVAAVVLTAASPAWARDVTVTSFDGTPISTYFFPAAGLAGDQRAPTVLLGTGYAARAFRDPDGPDTLEYGSVGVGTLRRAGYNVVTWDPRGFGPSGGQAELNSPAFEALDASALITWLADQPEAQLDGPADPRVGMAGGSYGGTIQLVTAATDGRVDAIVPGIAWHRLESSLYKARTFKTAWADLLLLGAAAAGQRDNPIVAETAEQVRATGIVPADKVAWFRSRGPGRLVSRIKAPTLLFQGTVDTLFTLQEAVENHRILRARGVPTKMVWFCGGHGACLTPQGDLSVVGSETLRWFDRHLRGLAVDTGPGFEWVDQRGRHHRHTTYPPERAHPLTATGRGSLALVDDGGSGPYDGPWPAGSLGPLLANVTPDRAENAVNVRLRAPRAAAILGAPRLTLAYRGRARSVRGRVLAQIVDEASGKVLGNQITPVALRMDGRLRRVTLPLEIVAATARRGQRLTLQIVARSSLYDTKPKGGTVRLQRIRLSLPTVQLP